MHQDTGMQLYGSSWHPGVVWSGGDLGEERAQVGGASGDAGGSLRRLRMLKEGRGQIVVY